MNDPNDLFSKLMLRLNLDLPGIDAHRKMIPLGRSIEDRKIPDTAIQSSVMIVLFPFTGEWNIVLIKRPESMRHHAGQISFPGGRKEDEESLKETALRETEEELGIRIREAEVVGKLTSLYVPVSNFVITPYLAVLEKTPLIQASSREVEDYFFVSVNDLMKLQFRTVKTIDTHRDLFLEAPGFQIDHHFVWGATAMILSEFLETFDSIIQ